MNEAGMAARAAKIWAHAGSRPASPLGVPSILVDWFGAARSAGILPGGAFRLGRGVQVEDPELLCRWLAGVIERGDTGATAREAERVIRLLFEMCEGWTYIQE